MSEPVLTIDYSGTDADLVLHAPDGTEFVVQQATEDTPTTEDVPRTFLLTEDFSAAVKAGTVTFAALPASPPAAKRALAVEVMRFLLNGIGPELLTAAQRMLEGERALEKLRDAYNTSYQQVKKLIQDGNGLAAGTQNLADAADLLLATQVEQAAVTKATQDLAAHDAGFVTTANDEDITNSDDLQPYLTERRQLEAALAAAQAGLAAVQADIEEEFGAIRAALDDAAELMEALEPSDIGGLLNWTWTPPP